MTVELFLLAVLAADFVTDPSKLVSQKNPTVQKLLIEKMVAARSILGGSWSADGRDVVFEYNITGRPNLWTVASEGGWPTQLTMGDQAHSGSAWSPDGKWIAYKSDTDGNEVFDLYVVSPVTAEVVNLTNSPEDKEWDPLWSPDGKRLAYIYRAKGQAYYQIRVIDMATRQIQKVTEDQPAGVHYWAPNWSHDGKRLAFEEWNAEFDSGGFSIFQFETGKFTRVIERQPKRWFALAGWATDGKQMLIQSNTLNDKGNVAMLDLATKKLEWITRGEWESGAVFSPDGRKILLLTNKDGRSEVFLRDVKSGRQSKLPLPVGNHTVGRDCFSPDGSRILLGHTGSTTPNRLVVYSISTGKTAPITHALPRGVQESSLAASTLVHYPSKDRKFQISAYTWVPFNLERNGRNPVIVLAHGGPAGQIQDRFQSVTQYLVNLGYIVIAPNFRGSTGYGDAFTEANKFDYGGADLEDVRGAADWLIASGYVDPKKVAIFGASYGGYMTLMALARMPDFWAAGAALVPVVNWHTMLAADATNREYFIANLGDPVTNKALWDDRSPITHADKIRAPLLLSAGGHDPRCPRSEIEAIAAAVTSRGGLADLKVYENEGHGLDKIENQITEFRRVGDFMLKHMPPPAR